MFNNIKKQIADSNPEAIIWDGFDTALLGITSEGKAVYDISQMKHTLMTRDQMSEEDALEYLDFNVIGAYVGEFTPIHINLLTRLIYHYDKQV